MKFLKPEIFYSADDSNEITQLINKADFEYDNYLENNAEHLDKRLLNCYCKKDRFHDAEILEMTYVGSCENRNNCKDSLKLKLLICEKVIEIEFKNVTQINVIDLQESELCLYRLPYSYDSILLFELGFVQDQHEINFIVASGKEIYIRYKSTKINMGLFSK